MLLDKHSVFRADNRDELDNLLRTMAAGSVRAAKPAGDGPGFRCNAVLSDTLEMFALSSGFSATFDFDPFDEIRLVFPTRSSSRVAFDGKSVEVGTGDVNYILPVGVSVTEFHPTGYRALAVRIRPSDLKQKLVALCGEELQGQIEFAQPDASDLRFLRFVRRPLFVAAQELNDVEPMFHPMLLAEIKALTLTRLLLCAPHNFSKRLAPRPSAPNRSQLKLAEDYLASHWDKALDVCGLADAVGVSARTILRYFRESYGETPRDYMKKIRLERARVMLLADNEAKTVMQVALRCGFSSLGNFAASYRRRFGELPSKTLRRGR